jgi:hypothetical protein
MQNFMNVAQDLTAERLSLRFNAKSLLLALFLEFFASRALLHLCSSGKYRGIQPVPSSLYADIEQEVRDKFPQELAEPMLIDLKSRIPELSNDPVNNMNSLELDTWMHEQCPDYLTIEQFTELLRLGFIMTTGWYRRRKYERQIALGVRVVAWLLARLIQLVIIIGAVLGSGIYGVIMIGMTICTMLLCVLVCIRGMKIT